MLIEGLADLVLDEQELNIDEARQLRQSNQKSVTLEHAIKELNNSIMLNYTSWFQLKEGDELQLVKLETILNC